MSTLLVASLLASCGSSDGVTSGTSTKTPPVTIGYSANADDAIVRIGAPGWLPSLVIGGDGWAYQPSGDAADWTSPESMRPPVRPLSLGGSLRPAVAPAPPQPTPVQRRLLTPSGMQIVLALADELDLLAVPDVYQDPGVTDSGSTFVRLSVAAGTFEHVAYALGFDDEVGNRRNLERFVDAVGDLETLVGADNIGPAEAYVPAVFAVSMYNGYSFDDEITWPDRVPVEQGCVALPVDRFPFGVAGLYTAEVDGSPARVSVLPDLPGDDC
ncbi:MAG: hypothetical protein ABIR32_08630 [Ilumatobacteraceae bacterium]